MTYEESEEMRFKLGATYPNDIEEAFVNEFLQFTSVVQKRNHRIRRGFEQQCLALNELLTGRQGLLMSTFPIV